MNVRVVGRSTPSGQGSVRNVGSGIPWLKKYKSGEEQTRGTGARLQNLNEIETKTMARLSTGIGELDRVLGEGLVLGEVCLMIGEPGIGKSTLLTQLSLNLERTVYVCGEESPGQVRLRIERMQKGKKAQNKEPKLKLLAETDVDVILTTIEKEDIALLIIDSVQTLYTADLPGMAGSVGQIRECTGRLIAYAKRKNVPIMLVGHVTKEGEMAGPKVLEHMVDAVLELTGDRYYDLRILRTQKNRFGATDEVGVFQMSETGMMEVTNPSQLFLAEREEGAIGSAVAVIMEGTRPVLVEVQALVVESELPVPRRVAQGVDARRVQILLGVLQKYTRLAVGSKDVFVKVTGGLSVKEPAIDLATVLAIASSVRGKALPKNAVAIGEVGLLGEIRSVGWEQKREKEAQKLGYTQIYSRSSQRSNPSSMYFTRKRRRSRLLAIRL
ncbi:MAG: repair protein radA protein [Microgenomates group bacterium GW2011_GWF1_46_12]|nr:MAG: repair protein radA protein [Microgenomates group bacterium GW2011_GWF1_46_12]